MTYPLLDCYRDSYPGVELLQSQELTQPQNWNCPTGPEKIYIACNGGESQCFLRFSTINSSVSHKSSRQGKKMPLYCRPDIQMRKRHCAVDQTCRQGNKTSLCYSPGPFPSQVTQRVSQRPFTSCKQSFYHYVWPHLSPYEKLNGAEKKW